MNFCNCQNCRTENCPNGVEYQALKDIAETLRQEIKEFYNVTAINEHAAPHDMLVKIVGVIRESANEILARPNKPSACPNSPPDLPADGKGTGD